MERQSSYVYGSTLTTPRRAVKTPKVIASEVAIGDQSYYGVFRAIGDSDTGGPIKYYNPYYQQHMQYYNNSYFPDVDDGHQAVSGVNYWEEQRTHSQTIQSQFEQHEHSSSYVDGEQFDPLSFSSPLPLQLFINSLSDALSYTSVETGTTDYQYNYTGGGGPSTLNATPMGSTTKLITSDTSNSLEWQCCKAKCFPIFGTLFMTISLAVSLGNILRLPTVVFLHGGGSFLIAYVTIAFLLGVPLIFLEITLGQFCQQGTTKLWRAVPLFKGVGFAKILSSLLVSLYYPILTISTLLYSMWSLIHPLPTSQCITKLLPRYTGPVDEGDEEEYSSHLCSIKNETVTRFFDGELSWFGAEICLLFTIWLIIGLCIFKGAKSFRMSCCIIVPISLFIVITLLTEGLQRNMTGLNYLFHFRWETLLTFDLWYHALVQFFFSTHVGFGNITTCAGRLYPKNNPFWTSVFYILVNMLVGIGFVFTVYMWIGDLISSGNAIHIPPHSQELFVLTLIYDVTSQCYGQFSQLWANIAFLLIILAALTSLISLVYTVVVGIIVETKTKWAWWSITAMFCFIGFIITCCSLLPENFSIVRLLDHYVVGKVVITSTVLEIIGFVWVYGLEALANDFEFVLGYKLNIMWKMLWFLSPIILSVIEIWSWFALSITDTSHHRSDSTWLYVIGWLVYFSVWSVIIGIAAWQVTSQVDYNLAQKFISCIKPSRNWGPVDPIYRHCWVQWRKQYQATGEKDFTLRRRGTRDYTHSVKRGRHAGPVGMRYSVNPPSNQNTLQYKMEKDTHLEPHMCDINTITNYSSWTSNNSNNNNYK